MYREPRVTPLEVLREVFWERQPRQIKLPFDLRIGINVWGERRFWITLSGEQKGRSCPNCTCKSIVGGKVYGKLPFSKRYKEELYG